MILKGSASKITNDLCYDLRVDRH